MTKRIPCPVKIASRACLLPGRCPSSWTLLYDDEPVFSTPQFKLSGPYPLFGFLRALDETVDASWWHDGRSPEIDDIVAGGSAARLSLRYTAIRQAVKAKADHWELPIVLDNCWIDRNGSGGYTLTYQPPEEEAVLDDETALTPLFSQCMDSRSIQTVMGTSVSLTDMVMVALEFCVSYDFCLAHDEVDGDELLDHWIQIAGLDIPRGSIPIIL